MRYHKPYTGVGGMTEPPPEAPVKHRELKVEDALLYLDLVRSFVRHCPPVTLAVHCSAASSPHLAFTSSLYPHII